MLKYDSLEKLVKEATKKKLSLGELVLLDQSEVLEKPMIDILNQIFDEIDVMEEAYKKGKSKNIKSSSGLSGGDAYLLANNSKHVAGEFFSYATNVAIAVAEANAAMEKIVAAPTAGSCGILPAAILTQMHIKKANKQQAAFGMLAAGAVGLVIANKMEISGASGGCQAECGVASAMAAAALIEMNGGSPLMIPSAVSTALSNQMGLVCDPVAGLVEIPCIKRNAGGIAIAISACELALAGIKNIIPSDEVIDAMKEVGNKMATEYKETACGALAKTPTAQKLAKKIGK